MAKDAFGNYIVDLTPFVYTPGNSTRGSLNGVGAPDSSLGQEGDTYVDNSTGDFYVKGGDTWTLVQGASGGSGEAGVGSPEGVVSAPVGTTYVDLNPPYDVWFKISGSGNTGWVMKVE